MLKKLAVLVCAVLFLTSCSQSNEEQPEEIFYHYTGELIGLVNQKKEPVNKEYGITYTLSIDKFNPTEHVFDKYNATYPQDYEGFRHIEFTERTKVYIQKGNTKTLISPSELNRFIKPTVVPRTPDTTYQMIEFWIRPYKMMDSYIEAVEVIVLQD